MICRILIHLTLFIALLIGSVNTFAESDTQEIVFTNFFLFKPDSLTNEVVVRTFYPSNFFVNVSLISYPNWLKKDFENCTNVHYKYTFTVKPEFRHSGDKKGSIKITKRIKKDGNGNPGFFDETKVSESMPIDCTLLYICGWDPANDSQYGIDETNKYAYLSYGIPNITGTNSYILFKKKSDDDDDDKDYYILTPKDTSYQIWTKNKGERNQSLTLKLIQDHTVKKSINIPKSHKFINLLSCDNLSTGSYTYALVEHEGGALSNDVSYCLANFNATPLEENIIWSNLSPPTFLSSSKTSDIFSFMACDDEIAVDFSFQRPKDDVNLEIDFYDGDFQPLEDNCITFLDGEKGERSFPKTDDKNYFIRYNLSNLEISNNYFISVSLNPPYENILSTSIKMSRIRPVFLVHGIDACPRYDGDKSFFGDLINATQYYNVRPYRVYDFPWTSFNKEGILAYVGKSEETLGKFIMDRRTNNDLKATIVAHSMGCLLTYYQCNDRAIKFRDIVDNIVLTAPPFFGSSAANTANHIVWNWLTPYLKRTSAKNFELLSRTTEHVWERYNNPFDFEKSKITVIIGTRKYIEFEEAGSAIVDSLQKIESKGDLINIKKMFDALADVALDSIEAIAELLTHALMLGQSTISLDYFSTSELFYKNVSDSAVGIYSANIKAQHPYAQVKNVEIFDIHSNLQKYQAGNEAFVNAVNERINNKGD